MFLIVPCVPYCASLCLIVPYTVPYWFRILPYLEGSDDSLVVLIRPDAKWLSTWAFRQSSIGGVGVNLTLRDGTACQLPLKSGEILLPLSDIHDGEYDDTVAVGLGGSIRRYVRHCIQSFHPVTQEPSASPTYKASTL